MTRAEGGDIERYVVDPLSANGDNEARCSSSTFPGAIGSFRQDQTFTGDGVNDQPWSTAAD